MQILIKKDFTWSHSGRLVNYVKDQVIEVDNKTAESMIKHDYGVLKEEKMFDHDTIENKMFDHNSVEDKSIVNNKKSKKHKGIENE